MGKIWMAMRVSREFSKYAASYGTYNQIQKKVAQTVVSHMQGNPKKVLDLGCGDGAIAKLLNGSLEKLVAVDFAQGMVDLHPKASNIECYLGDFNDYELFDSLQDEGFDYVLSASALQWALDLNITLGEIAKLNAPVSFGIFTKNTFAQIHKTAGVAPILESSEVILQRAKKFFNLNHELITYQLEFENTAELFGYIKKSGVSGGRGILGFKETKKLLRNYTSNILEFEVLYLWS